MSELSDLENRAKSNPHILIKTGQDGNKVAVLGLDGSGKAGNQIAPLTVTFDKAGKALFAEVPNQSHSGSFHVDLNAAPKVKEALLNNATRHGADFLANVGRQVGGSYEANHSDARKSLGASNPDAAVRGALHGEVAGRIAGAAGRAAGGFDRVAKPLAIAAGLMAAATGARASDGTANGMAEGAAAGFIEHLAPEVANGNSTCTKLGGVTRFGAAGVLGAVGSGAGVGFASIPLALGGAWVGVKIGDGVEALCKMATSEVASDNLAAIKHKPTMETSTSHKLPDTTSVAKAPTQGHTGRS